jgi:DNA-binding transcriptional MerR regulator
MPSQIRPSEQWLSPIEAGKMLDLHPNTIKRYSNGGEFPYYRVGSRGDRRYKKSDLLAFMRRSRVDTSGKSTERK